MYFIDFINMWILAEANLWIRCERPNKTYVTSVMAEHHSVHAVQTQNYAQLAGD